MSNVSLIIRIQLLSTSVFRQICTDCCAGILHHRSCFPDFTVWEAIIFLINTLVVGIEYDTQQKVSVMTPNTENNVQIRTEESTTTNKKQTYINRLHCANTIDLLQELPPGIVDCVITSPPYWGLRSYDSDKQLGFEQSIESYVNNIYEVLSTTEQALKPSGTLFTIIGDQYQSTAPGTANTPSNINSKTAGSQGEHYRFDSGLPAKSLMSLPERLSLKFTDDNWVLRNKIIWEKSNPLPEPSATDRYQQSWEYIYFFSLNQQYYFNKEHASNTDVWTIPTANKDTTHPAPYPIELCKRMIRAACPPDGVILDPFVGSGTTCIAAKQLGRDYIGIDLNKEYLQEAQKELNTTIRDASTDEQSTMNNTLYDSDQQRLDEF